jgi:hypothetical protein
MLNAGRIARANSDVKRILQKVHESQGNLQKWWGSLVKRPKIVQNVQSFSVRLQTPKSHF